MHEPKCLILNWNVRGLNNKARRKVVKDLVQDTKCTIVTLQETKLQSINAADISETLGERFSKHFAYLPAQGTRGGVLVAVDDDYYSITHAEHREHTVSVYVVSTQSLVSWWLTVVYGPHGDTEKIEFMRELRDIIHVVSDNQGRMHTPDHPGHGPGFGPIFFHFAVASTSGFGSIAEEGLGSIAEEE